MTLVKRIVAVLIALSFIAMVVPVGTVSFAGEATMACCEGKVAGHCDSGLKAKKPEPKPEPICGLKNAAISDEITVVAETTTDNNPSHDAVTHSSISKPCHADCCASGSWSKQSKRERGPVRVIARESHASTPKPVVETLKPVAESKHALENIIPRGPPVVG